LAIRNNDANKKMDSLNSTIEEQADAFKIGDKNVDAYRKALTSITASAK
jgi:hypothetical protein